MRLGVVTIARRAGQIRVFAQAAEQAGYWGLGVSDTAPLIYPGAYPTITACLLATSTLRVGTYVTNPVSRHWSVHGSNARALDDLAPGRFFLGL
jgi:alkanesulfonate monooxygenase SsuD/methylene tetrahydromethanopterin reductase-like flavin-dependent oxidoreductase (luciferase family)